MSSQRREKIRHIDEEDLLRYLDGEAPDNQAEETRVHLKECWQCRARERSLEDAIERFMQERSTDLAADAHLPPRAIERFETRLQELASSACRQSAMRRLAIAFDFGRPWLVTACLAILAVVGVLRLTTSSPPSVSANDALQRAADAEGLRLQNVPGPVVYQKLHVRRSGTRGEGKPTTVEIWSAPSNVRSRKGGDTALWRDVEQVFEANGMGNSVPLSPAGFAFWRNSLREKRDEVKKTRLPDGLEAIQVRTSAPNRYGASAIQEATLTFRLRDWHPIEQHLRVGIDNELREYELTEVDHRVVPLASLDTALFERPDSNYRPPDVRPFELAAPPPLVADSPAIEDAEVQVQFALHRIGACRGEEIEVKRSTRGRIVVQGLVETPQRREEIRRALNGLTPVDVELRTLEEATAAATVAPPGGRPADRQENRAALEVRGEGIPIEREVRRYFSRSTGASDDAVAFSNHALVLSEAALAEAWALRRLAERFAPERTKNLHLSALLLLGEMVRDHEEELSARVERLRSELEPVLWEAFAARPGTSKVESRPDWAQTSLMVFSTVARTNDLCHALLASGGKESDPLAAVQELFDRLAEFQDCSRRLDAIVASSFLHPTGVARDQRRQPK